MDQPFLPLQLKLSRFLEAAFCRNGCVFVCVNCILVCSAGDEGAPSCPVLKLQLAYRFLLIALLYLLNRLSGEN